MQHTSISGISATLTDDALVLEATKTMARVALGGRERRIPLDEIVAVELCEPKRLGNGMLLVATDDGRTELVFPPKELDVVHSLRKAVVDGVRDDVATTVTQKLWSGGAAKLAAQQERYAEDREARAEKVRQLEEVVAERAEERAETKAANKAAREAREARELEKYGARIASELFGGYLVDIYANGYVAYGIAHHGKPKRLLGIEGEVQVWKKTALGRAIVAIPTLMLNLLGPNIRGDAYLTIVTDEGVKKLHESPPNSRSIKAMYAIEAAGKVALEAARDKR